jgi:hypothetical protein
MQIKHFLFGGAMAVSLFACAPASRYEADGAFSSEPAFSQVVRPEPATSKPPVSTIKPDTTPVNTMPPVTDTTVVVVQPPATPVATPVEQNAPDEVVVGDATPANAGGGAGVNVLPESYTATTGNSTYIDDTGKQLIDNQVGSDRFNAKIFGTAGFEWVGWSRQNVSMNFKFASERKFTKVKIGFNYNSGAGILLPLKVTINGKAYDLKGTELKRNTRGFLVFNVAFTSNQITIDLERNPARQWILVDEVKFVAVQQNM